MYWVDAQQVAHLVESQRLRQPQVGLVTQQLGLGLQHRDQAVEVDPCFGDAPAPLTPAELQRAQRLLDDAGDPT